MKNSTNLSYIKENLFSIRHATKLELSKRELSKLVKNAEVLRIYHGWYCNAMAWQNFTPTQKHIAKAYCFDANAKTGRPTFSHQTAALIWGLPGIKKIPHQVHIVNEPGSPLPGNKHVMRHHLQRPLKETTTVGGLEVTSLLETLAMLLTGVSSEESISLADFVARIFGANRVGDETFREEVLARLPERTRGIIQARKILETADPAADSPLESISRLYLLRLGYTVQTQIEIPAPHNRKYYVDFELEGLDVLCEVDGLIKYRDKSMLSGKSVEEALIAEKEREDWIRGVTGKRLIRWGWKDIKTFDHLRSRLREFNVPQPNTRRLPPI